MTALYHAVAANDVEKVRELLAQGADPNDGESFYHSTEHRDLGSLRLLLAHGARVKGSNAVNHMLDREDPVGLRLLLVAGADLEENAIHGASALQWAIFRRRGAEIVTMLLDAGAKIDSVGSDGRHAYARAALSGMTQVAQLLASRGADTSLSPLERAIAEGGDYPPYNGSAKDAKVMAAQAAMHRTEVVKQLIEAGYPVSARGDELGATPLHWACWKGYPDLAELLLAHGASLSIEDSRFNATPAGWLDHGMKNCHEHGADYGSVRRMINSTLRPNDQA